jgi:hypothetical protein
MATYVNDLRLTELATGEGSGSWGTTTNLSLELIGEALGYATQQSFGSDADATTTVADGASDPARAMYFKITSAGSLTATRTLTIAPNTISRVMFIENATTGSQSIAISQGSGASVTILTGKTAVVYLDGAGAAAAVVDAMASVDPGVTDTLAEVLAAGNTSGGTNIELSTTDKVQFRDAAIYINSSVDGQLDIVADTEIQIAATTIDVNGTLAFDSLKGTGATTVTNILDEDNMASDSATAIATQQSIKAYVDSQVGTVDTLSEILANGNTTGANDIDVDAAQKVQFRDAAIYINSSVDGQLDIVADTEIQIAATTVDLNGNLDVSGTALVTGVLTTTAATVFNGGFASNADSTLGTDKKVQFRDSAIYINSSADGQLDIVADTEIQIAATTVDLNGNLDVSGTALVTGVLTTTAATVFNGGFASNADSTLGTDKKVQFRDAAIYINSSVDGQLDIVADTEIQIAATTIDINGNADVSGTLGVTGAATFTGEIAANGGIALGDNDVATFGLSDDLQIYHSGSHSFIKDVGTGNLYIDATSLYVRSATGEPYIVGTADAGVSIYHDNAIKLATTATGIDVTGTVTASGAITLGSGIANNTINLNNSTADMYLGISGGSLFGYASGAISAIFNTSAVPMGIGPAGAQDLILGTYSTARVTIDGTTGAATFSGNVGIGVTPNAWAPSVYKAIQLGTSNGVGVIAARVDAVNEVNFGLNWYYDGGTNVEYTASSYATNYAQGSGAHSWKTAASGTAGANITWTDAMTLDASGNLLVGHTAQVLSSKVLSQFSGATHNGIIINETADTASTTFAAFSLSGTAIGSITRVGATSAVAYNTTSDERLKSNIANSDPVLEKIMQVQVRQYDWTEGNLHQDYGFIAQELAPVLSGIVTEGKEEADMWQLDYSRLTPALLKAIQEQQAIIDALTARIEALEGA